MLTATFAWEVADFYTLRSSERLSPTLRGTVRDIRVDDDLANASDEMLEEKLPLFPALQALCMTFFSRNRSGGTQLFQDGDKTAIKAVIRLDQPTLTRGYLRQFPCGRIEWDGVDRFQCTLCSDKLTDADLDTLDTYYKQFQTTSYNRESDPKWRDAEGEDGLEENRHIHSHEEWGRLWIDANAGTAG
jgi:hypothetical protein